MEIFSEKKLTQKQLQKGKKMIVLFRKNNSQSKPVKTSKSKSKYKNVKTPVDGIIFDSKREATHYLALTYLQKQGKIKDLKLQVPFIIAPSYKPVNGRARPAIKYVADFVYINEDGKQVVEDVKGFKTDVYKLKRHLMHTVHGIDVVEV